MRSVTAILTATVAALGLACAPAAAAPLQTLTAQDAQIYAAAFSAAEQGDFDAADAQLARVTDPCLVGKVRYLELTHVRHRNNTFDDLSSWLRSFGDLPGADKVYALAMKLRPAGLTPPTPTAPVMDTADGNGGQRAAPQSRAARDAFFGGDVTRALGIARGDGDVWIAGLAAWRLARFAEALGYFETIANNPAEKDGQRAAGAYWAARAAQAAGAPERVAAFLKIAAGAPDTFYGMIAVRRLAMSDDPLDRIITASARTAVAPAPQPVADGSDPALARFVSSEPRARRAVALNQIGRPVDAGAEMRAGVAEAADGASRTLWMKLIYALNPNSRPAGEVVLHSSVAAAPQPSAFYPTPALAPAGGFTVDKALVYAVVWQESRFNSLAVSPVGAIGLMQLMPPTAGDVAGDSSLRQDPIPLFDTGKNLQLGQAYLNTLLSRYANYDILRAVAAYNGGPATVTRTVNTVGADADSLTLIESIPFAETRAYVQKVMAAYWAYRRQFGVESRTLDAVASDAPLIDARLDASVPSQNAKPADSPGTRQALEVLLRREG